jgi:hypothetical protein
MFKTLGYMIVFGHIPMNSYCTQPKYVLYTRVPFRRRPCEEPPQLLLWYRRTTQLREQHIHQSFQVLLLCPRLAVAKRNVCIRMFRMFRVYRGTMRAENDKRREVSLV